MSKRRNQQVPVTPPAVETPVPAVASDTNQASAGNEGDNGSGVAGKERGDEGKLRLPRFDSGDAEELRLTEDDVYALEIHDITDAKGIRDLKNAGFLAGLCGWSKDHAELILSRANDLRFRQLTRKAEDGEVKQTTG